MGLLSGSLKNVLRFLLTACLVLALLRIYLSFSQHEADLSKPLPSTAAATAAKSEDILLFSGITVVTAYLNFDTKDGTEASDILYFQHMRSFSHILNPVVAYFDNQKLADVFEELRIGLPTKIAIVELKNLLSFKLRPRIEEITRKSGAAFDVPRLCASHAKYDVMSLALQENAFKTKHFCWLDIDYYRDIVQSTSHAFKITLPGGFIEDRVAFNAAFSRKPYSIDEIFNSRYVWITSNIIIGSSRTLLTFCEEYRSALSTFLSKGMLVSADEQVLYAMYSEDHDILSLVRVNEYAADPRVDNYHSLGIILREFYYRKLTNNN